MLGLKFSVMAHAQHHTDFIPLSIPAPHLLESNVRFGQDSQGQVWLVSENGLSAFRDVQFVSYKTFDFESPAKHAVFGGNEVLVATTDQLLQVSLSDPLAAPKVIWQFRGQAEIITSLYQPSSGSELAFVVTNLGLYKLQWGNGHTASGTSQPELIKQWHGEPPVDLSANETGLYLLFESEIHLYDLKDLSWQTQSLSNPINSIKSTTQGLVGLSPDGQVISITEFNSPIQATPYSGTELIGNSQYLYVRNGVQLQSVLDSKILIKEANYAKNVFIDSYHNFWLSTPFDIQVAWWQPLSSQKVTQPSWGKYFASSQLSQDGRYAIKSSTVYERSDDVSGGVSNWNPVWQNRGEQSFNHILNTAKYLWLWGETNLMALDKRSLTVSMQLAKSSKDLVFAAGGNRILLASSHQVVEVTGQGKVQQIKSLKDCGESCLPNFTSDRSALLGNTAYFATSKGLQSYDFVTNVFSTDRLDYLNQLSPLLSVYPYDEHHLWLIYPNKLALFDTETNTSKIYYSDLNRIFDAHLGMNKDIVINTQRSWLAVSGDRSEQQRAPSRFVVQQVMQAQDQQLLKVIEDQIEIAQDQSELRLAFNMGKQHPSQTMSVRFKYQGDASWSEVSMYNRSLTLKNLRQGSNLIQLQARLEGQHWQHAKSIRYILPYRFFQTRWVMAFIAGFLMVLIAIIAYERFGRLKVVFKAIKQQAFITSLLESTREGVWIANQDREIQSVNQAFVDITGYTLDQVEGASFQLQTDFGRNHEVESLIWQEVIKSGFWSGEIWTKRESGDKLSIDLSVTRVETENKVLGKTDVRFVGVFSDVTERKKSERDLRQLATRDPLTNLANRTLFIEKINHSIDTISPVNPHFAVMFLDLDNFKKVNESLGPIEGDEFLRLVGERIASCVTKGISVARMGGDEFALLIPAHLFSGVPAFYIKRIATDIQRELQPAFCLRDTEISITASMGVSIYPNHGDKPELLMRCADTALNRVKITGRNNCLIYDHVMDDMADDRLSLESELIGAINNDEFLVYYQPKYKIKENEVCGFEALIRWQNPARGLVPPDQFISIAEENGLIRQLDFWVLRTVCRQISKWLKAGTMRGKVAVNISALNFQQADFCESVLNLMNEEGNLIDYIELEVTETAMMRDPERALESIKLLKNKGFSIALDDFGTGHSSLGYLKRFPIDRLKIDRTFVKEIEFSTQDRNITSVIVQLAKHLGIAVIAEGIETEEQAYLLHVMGCNEIQGYFVSRPIVSEQVESFVKVDARKLQGINEHGKALL